MNKYNIKKFLGKGSFSNVFLGNNKLFPEKMVAIKIEPIDTELNTLLHECKILLYLNGINGIVRVHWFSRDDINRYLVLDYYEYSLQDKIILNLSPREKNSIYDKILNTLRVIHSRKIIHCDIKPANIMCKFDGGGGGCDLQVEPYIIDFGMAHVSSVQQQSTQEKKGDENSHEGPTFGSIRFMSIRLHRGCEPCYEDDIESLYYVYLFLTNGGKLPWDNCNNEQTMERKQLILNTRANSAV